MLSKLDYLQQDDRLTVLETGGAELIRSLTYGEMIEFASALQQASGGAEITAGTLAIILHGWACEHGK
jgi:hypothetical protein